MDRTSARRVFLLLSATRWLPVGLVFGLYTLVPLQRGLDVPQVTTFLAAQGIAIMLLELPTSGFSDAFGRKPVLLVAGVLNVVAAAGFALADSFWAFACAAFVMGIYRALDSGPLEAWYVDTVHATEPGADVDRDLAHQGTVLGLSIASTAVLSGGLIAWDPIGPWHPFTLPLVLYVGGCGLHLLATALLLRETPRAEGPGRAWASVKQTPRVVGGGLRLLGGNRVLLALVAVEFFAGTAMVVFETFQPIRLAELLGSQTEAGAWSGPVGALGWAVFSVGAALAGYASPRLGVARTAMLARVLNSLGVVVMALAAGPLALVAAYLLTYGLHGSHNPPHAALLHREASAANRTTILSLASLASFAGASAMSPALGQLAGATTTQVAMLSGGVVSLFGVLLYLPAHRKEQAALAGPAQEVSEDRAGRR